MTMMGSSFSCSCSSFLQVVVVLLACSLRPSPFAAASSAPNITEALTDAGNFTTFLEVATQLNVTAELQAHLDADNGLTLFIPTDDVITQDIKAAFNRLPAEKQKLLLQYHAIPVYYGLSILNSEFDIPTFAPSFNLTNITVDTYFTSITVYGSINSATVIEDDFVSGVGFNLFAIDNVLLPFNIFNSTTAPPPPPSSNGTAPPPSSSDAGVTPPTSTLVFSVLTLFSIYMPAYCNFT